jgi:hypothetical protein
VLSLTDGALYCSYERHHREKIVESRKVHTAMALLVATLKSLKITSRQRNIPKSFRIYFNYGNSSIYLKNKITGPGP